MANQDSVLAVIPNVLVTHNLNRHGLGQWPHSRICLTNANELQLKVAILKYKAVEWL